MHPILANAPVNCEPIPLCAFDRRAAIESSRRSTEGLHSPSPRACVPPDDGDNGAKSAGFRLASAAPLLGASPA
jgi:hypothetical protein